MVAFSKRNLTKKYPKPSDCIVEMIQLVLQVSFAFRFASTTLGLPLFLQKLPEGRRINFTKLTELSDLRVLASLINYFVPNLIPTEILLNDR